MSIVAPPGGPVSNPAPYYSDDFVTLYHGRCEDVLPHIEPESVDVLLTDPPYFQVKEEEWDRQWKKRDEFLTWLGDVLDAAAPSLRSSSSVWVFASPLLTSTIEREVVDPRFRLLNSIRWVKEAGWHQKAEIEAQRRYLTAWEGVIFAERLSDPRAEEAFHVYRTAAKVAHAKAFAPLGAYFKSEREKHGISRSDLEVMLGYASSSDPSRGTALYTRWEEGAALPTRAAYARLQAALGGDYFSRSYEDLEAESARLREVYMASRSDYDDLRVAYEDTRRPFRLSQRGPVTDIWNFQPVMGYAGKHPCEKPLAMLDHMIGVSSKPGAMILDPFAGSGSTLRAAKDAGRRAIGIEMDERWCERAANRLAQDVLDFGEVGA